MAGDVSPVAMFKMAAWQDFEKKWLFKDFAVLDFEKLLKGFEKIFCVVDDEKLLKGFEKIFAVVDDEKICMKAQFPF